MKKDMLPDGEGGGGGVWAADLHWPPGPVVAVQQTTVDSSKHVLAAEGTYSHQPLLQHTENQIP